MATMADIAKRAGVAKTTVSAVFSGKWVKLGIAQKTRERILGVAKELNYQPNATARALAARRTSHIGFILSDEATGGWTNVFYAALLQGVETECHQRGYALSISRYNLSNIESFVFPARVGQRAVDALVLAGGCIRRAVVERFREFGIPCVAIGDNLEVAGLVPTVSYDVLAALQASIEHLASLGHKRIGFLPSLGARGLEVAELMISAAASAEATAHCSVAAFASTDLWGNYRSAGPLMETWLAMDERRRPTAIVATDQTLVGFVKMLRGRGLECPRDVSLISPGDTLLCEVSNPGLTAVRHDLEQLGAVAADMLINHLEDNAPLTVEMSRNDFPFELIRRESTDRPAERA